MRARGSTLFPYTTLFRSDVVGDPEIDTRISAYELAYRMQTSVPDLTDIADEPAHIHELYGTEPGQTSFANNCLLARRLDRKSTRLNSSHVKTSYAVFCWK